MSDVCVVAIGRNEGDRLKRCLQSVIGKARGVVYVDSGSTDGSVDLARALGAEVVELDLSRPFCAARARNEGLDYLVSLWPDAEFVQFVDGDCELVDGWLEAAVAAMGADSRIAAVCGYRRERYPEASIYNRLCDLEWNEAPGLVASTGGDAMMRISALRELGGFDPSVPAGEEPELCARLRHQGWKILRLDVNMTLHDAAMSHFGQWWRRQVRTGYGGMDVATRFGLEFFAHIARSARIWAVGWPAVVIVGGVAGTMAAGLWMGVFIAGVLFGAMPVQMARIARRKRRQGVATGMALAYALLTMLGKWGQVSGQLRWWRDQRARRPAALIEYKAAMSR